MPFGPLGHLLGLHRGFDFLGTGSGLRGRVGGHGGQLSEVCKDRLAAPAPSPEPSGSSATAKPGRRALKLTVQRWHQQIQPEIKKTSPGNKDARTRPRAGEILAVLGTTTQHWGAYNRDDRHGGQRDRQIEC